MEQPHVHHSHFRFASLYEKIQKFSRASRSSASTPTILVKHRALFRGVTFLICGFAITLLAHQLSVQSGEEAFMRSTWPHPRLWQNTLKQFSFEPVLVSENTLLLQKHPHPYDSKPDIWISDNHAIIYISASPFHEQQPELWCRSLEKNFPTPLNWVHLGVGIVAFNSLVKILDEEPLKRTKSQNLKRNMIDPKEIRY